MAKARGTPGASDGSGAVARSAREALLARMKLAASAAKVFVDRSDLVRLFVTRLHEEPEVPQVLFFHGDGGNGKSSVLAYLQENCLKVLRPHHWRKIKALPDAEFAREIAASQGALPVAWTELDLGDPNLGPEAQDPLVGLARLRRGLDGPGLRFPTYDFAQVCYLEKAGRLKSGQDRDLAGMVGLASALAGSFTDGDSSKAVALALGLFAKLLGLEYEKWKARRGLDREYLETIQALPLDQLGQTLPELLALDLLAATSLDNAPKRVVIFVDGHERLRLPSAARPIASVPDREEWLRRLVKVLVGCPEGQRIVVVMAGRTLPDWRLAPRESRIEPGHMAPAEVGNLTFDDAREYLAQRHIVDPSLQDAILTCARVTAGEVHPLYLSLCADTAVHTTLEGKVLGPGDFRQAVETDRIGEEALARLLSQVGIEFATAIVALSACREFDDDVYAALGRVLGFPPDAAYFHYLTASFSFVRPVDREGTRYRIHDLVRRLVREGKVVGGAEPVKFVDPGTVAAADQVLEGYYRAKAATGSSPALADAIYHAYQLDSERAARELIRLLRHAREDADFPLGHTLLALRDDIRPSEPRDQVWLNQEAGSLLQALGRLGEARDEFHSALEIAEDLRRRAPDSAEYARDLSICYDKLGGLHLELGDTQRAMELYSKDLEIAEDLRRRAPDSAECSQGLSISYGHLGDLHLELGDTQRAMELHGKALEIREDLRRRVPDSAVYARGLAIGYSKLGGLHLELGDTQRAMELHGKALEIHEDLRRRAPDSVEYAQDLAVSYANLGDLHLELGDTQRAMELRGKALEMFEDLRRRAPDSADHARNLSTSYSQLGRLHLKLGDTQRAMELHGKALEIREDLRRRAPDSAVYARGLALSYANLGDLHLELGDTQRAMELYGKDLEIAEDLRRRAPDSAEYARGLAVSYTHLGDLHLELGDAQRAMELYGKALEICEDLRRRAPDSAQCAQDLSTNYSKLGSLHLELGDTRQAMELHGKALEIREDLRRRAPDSAEYARDLSISYSQLGDLHLELGDTQRSIELCGKALEILEDLRRRAPDSAEYARDVAVSYLNLGSLHLELGDTQQAMELHGKALGMFEDLLRRSPDSAENARNLSTSCGNLAHLHLKLGDTQRAMELQGKALEIREDLRRRAPDSAEYARDLAVTYVDLGDLHLELGDTQRAMELYGKALEICEDLQRRAPDSAEHAWGLVITYSKLSDLHLKLGDTQRAMELERKVREIIRRYSLAG